MQRRRDNLVLKIRKKGFRAIARRGLPEAISRRLDPEKNSRLLRQANLKNLEFLPGFLAKADLKLD